MTIKSEQCFLKRNLLLPKGGQKRQINSVHPGVSAGLAVLRVLSEERLQDAALATGHHLTAGLRRLQVG